MVATAPEPQVDPEAAGQPAGRTERGREEIPRISAPTAVDSWPSVTASATGGSGREVLDPVSIFLLGLLLSASGLVPPPVALLGGVAYGFSVPHPLRRQASSLSKLLLQLSVILLGFGINLHQVLQVGRSGFMYTALSIGLATALGLLLGKVFRLQRSASFLITMGTAICGGSAIAALAPIIQANEEDISVSMGTVFVLNAVALLIFPAIGGWLHLTQDQFGLWAALAIHDTSSVVGAAARYGPRALEIGTTVKLARALWIVPVSLLTASWVSRSKGSHAGARARIKVPWFIFLFLLASVVSTFFGRFAPVYTQMNHLGRLGLTATLFLIGTGLSKRTLQQVGIRPLLQGVLLWVLVGCASLSAIYLHWISV